MNNVFIEENGAYSIDCSNAVWASDRMHKDYHDSGIHINDVDFLIEDASHILMVEYKNANFSGAVNPEAFQPLRDKKISIVTRKFYDSLHYLKLLNKEKPVQYIYVLEYPDGDVTMRKRLRNRLKFGDGKKLIDKVEVMSIAEWNGNEKYGIYPIKEIGNCNGEKQQ